MIRDFLIDNLLTLILVMIGSGIIDSILERKKIKTPVKFLDIFGVMSMILLILILCENMGWIS